MNTKLRARIDFLLGEFDKVGEKKSREYMDTHKSLDTTVLASKAIEALRVDKDEEFSNKNSRIVKVENNGLTNNK